LSAVVRGAAAEPAVDEADADEDELLAALDTVSMRTGVNT